MFYCCKKRIPLNGLIIEGVTKIVMVSIGKVMLIVFYSLCIVGVAQPNFDDIR